VPIADITDFLDVDMDKKKIVKRIRRQGPESREEGKYIL
jgi:hypothetical protein